MGQMTEQDAVAQPLQVNEGELQAPYSRRMTVAVFGQDAEGNMVELGRPTYIDVPPGCRVIMRARSVGMLPFEFDSQQWSRDGIISDQGPGVGLHEESLVPGTGEKEAVDG